MSLLDILKAILAVLAYLGLGPALGLFLRSSRAGQRLLFGLMVFMTSWFPKSFTFMLDSIETYRGHVKGFEFSFLEVFAVAMLVATAARPTPRRRLLPPGLPLYLAWCLAGLSTLFAAYQADYALMAFFRFSKVALILAAAYYYLRSEEDLVWALNAMAGALVVQGLVCFYQRHFLGAFQTHGWFEHQNAMALWAYQCGCIVLAVAISARLPRELFWLYTAGYVGSGVCIVYAVSRGALGAFAAGSCLIVLIGWLRGPNVRLIVFSALGLVGALTVLLAVSTFKARVQGIGGEQDDFRTVLKKQSLAMFHDHPWSGVGWNNYGIANSRPRGERYSRYVEDWDQARGFRIYDENYYANALPESVYYLWLAELGLPGFLLFCLFLLSTLWWSWRCARHYGNSLAGYFATGLFVILLASYLHSSVERILVQPKNLSMWMILLGLLGSLEMNRRRDRELERIEQRRRRAALRDGPAAGTPELAPGL